MRIGFLCYPTHGGSGVIASELAASLSRAGDDVHLVSHAVPPRLQESDDGVKVHVARGAPYPLFERAPHELALASRLLEEHARAPFDLLHAHYALPHAVVAWLVREAAQAPAPMIVTTLHGTDTNLVGGAPEYAPILSRALEASDAVTAVSESSAAEARAAFGMQEGPLVIPDFVDVDRFRPASSRGDGPLRVLHVSNFRPLKRVPWLVESFAAATLDTQIELWLVGEGPDREAAEQRAHEFGIEQRTRFFGPQLELPQIMAEADVFVLASQQESFGLSALEAMSCAVPVLAPAVGGLPEVLRDGLEGRLVPLDDRNAWKCALQELLADDEARRSLGLAARERAVQRFAREGVVERYRALYRGLLKTRRTR